MEPSYHFTRTEIIEVFKQWDIDHLKDYPDEKITDPEKDSIGQADEFIKRLSERREPLKEG